MPYIKYSDASNSRGNVGYSNANSSCGNVGNNSDVINSGYSVWNNSDISDERSQVMTWLSPLEPSLRHQDIRDRRVENVGEWLLQTEEFRSWYTGSGGSGSDNAVLFCCGNLGVGKTFISSLVIDRLCDQASGRGVAVACFYFDFAAQKEQSPESVLGALLKQLVSGLKKVPEGIAQAYREQKKVIGGRAPKLADIVKMLQTTSPKQRAFLCIDALDECQPRNRVDILDSLNQVLRKCPGTRVFVTGRPYIRPEIGRRLPGRVASLPISSKRHDIIGYLRARLGNDTNPEATDSSLETDILKKIPEDISEILLLVSLHIDAILQETTIRRRRQKLNTMTDGLWLGDAYGATLSRIKEQAGEKARLGMDTLMWISHSERFLKVDELRHALGVEIGSPDLEVNNVLSIETLLACCQGLVAVNEGDSTVRFIHFTVQEYLLAHPEIFGSTHSTIAETCLSYLNSQQVKALSASPLPDRQSTPFLEYSSVYWGVHAKRELSDCAKFLALKLFDDYDNHVSTRILLEAQECSGWIDHDNISLFSGLHCASIFGIAEIVACLIEVEGCDINKTDGAGNIPLLWAAWNGHEGVVEILLGRGEVNPNEPNEDGRTALWCAASNEHEGVVKILLERGDVDPDQLNRDGQTPLCCAASNGHEGIVKMLLERKEVDPHGSNWHGRTLLWCAASNGHEGIVKILLEREDVGPDQPNKDGRTLLWWAARNGREGVVKGLLEREDVDPNQQDIYGQSPLWCATEHGHEGVVRMLLRREGVNPGRPDQYGQTPLSCAAENGYEGVVKMLLGQAGVNPNEPDKYGETPLSCAALNGHEEVVKTLLERDELDPNQPNQDGRTPLWGAAEGGHEAVVKILLERDNVDPDKPDKYGQSPLWCACLNGHKGVVKILLERNDVNPNKPSEDGRTPLRCATESGHEGVVKTLLGRDDVNPDILDICGPTPL